mmetsp:Transcript_36696/g.56933  ORF Transcript_36696/g.56933 Transcript_36696/m.56933 type:complete len:195 (-) Transcript_36696:150-734(-)
MKYIISPVYGVCILLLGCLECQGFQQISWTSRGTQRVTTRMQVASARAFKEEKPNHFLLDEFSTHSGEVLNPYTILKVSRDADRTEIRRAYIELSKRYHPDGARHKEILPGRCNNLDDVREEWERIKLSYEILRDSRTRRRFDRHDMIADPGAAMRRAAFGAAAKGVVGIGEGLFNLGNLAVQQISKSKDEQDH